MLLKFSWRQAEKQRMLAHEKKEQKRKDRDSTGQHGGSGTRIVWLEDVGRVQSGFCPLQLRSVEKDFVSCDQSQVVHGCLIRRSCLWLTLQIIYHFCGMLCKDDEKPEKSVEIDPEIASTDSPNSSGSSFSGQTAQTVP